jgi:leader peptidase (prepilin peptidase)/N-methyltransferase
MNLCIFVALMGSVLPAAFHDARTGLIPDKFSLGGFLIICGLSYYMGILPYALIGAASAATPMFLLHVITGGRGLGFGDVKLAMPIGAALGQTVGLYALGFAFILGAVGGILLLLFSRMTIRQEMYFAPYLAAGTLAAIVGHFERMI